MIAHASRLASEGRPRANETPKWAVLDGPLPRSRAAQDLMRSSDLAIAPPHLYSGSSLDDSTSNVITPVPLDRHDRLSSRTMPPLHGFRSSTTRAKHPTSQRAIVSNLTPIVAFDKSCLMQVFNARVTLANFRLRTAGQAMTMWQDELRVSVHMRSGREQCYRAGSAPRTDVDTDTARRHPWSLWAKAIHAPYALTDTSALGQIRPAGPSGLRSAYRDVGTEHRCAHYRLGIERAVCGQHLNQRPLHRDFCRRRGLPSSPRQ